MTIIAVIAQNIFTIFELLESLNILQFKML